MSSKSRIIFHIDVNSAFLSWSAIRLLESGSVEENELVLYGCEADPDTGAVEIVQARV